MATVSEALEAIKEAASMKPIEKVSLFEATGRVLAEAVSADRAFPPYDRVMMDGIALKYEPGVKEWELQGEQTAGEPALSLKGADRVIAIATGAVLPKGCDTVVPKEHFEREGASVVLNGEAEVEQGQFIHRMGVDRSEGDILIETGVRIGPKEIGVCASCGKVELSVYAKPKVCVLSTGDELVEVSESPRAWQQRRSNDAVIRSFLQENACELVDVVAVPDDLEATSDAIAKHTMHADIVISTGGVSKGDKDFIRPALERVGAEVVFHGVEQRPGWPMLFATKGKALYFGLAGNPLSVLSGLHVCVAQAIEAMGGAKRKASISVALEGVFRCKGPHMHYLPVTIEEGGGCVLRAVRARVNNSGDFAGVLGTDGFLSIDGAKQKDYDSGSAFLFTAW